jgi:hypothetical protein
MMDLTTLLFLAAHDEWEISAESRELARDALAEIERLRGVDARLTAALLACGDVGKAYARADAETARAERASERLYRVLDPSLAAMQRADDAMTYGLEECERLRARVVDAEAEASRWGDAIVAIGEAVGVHGGSTAEVVAAVQRAVAP